MFGLTPIVRLVAPKGKTLYLPLLVSVSPLPEDGDMKTKRFTLTALLLLIATACHAQQSPSPQPAPASTVPCGLTPTVAKPTIKVPSGFQKYFDKYSPVSSSDISKTANVPKPTAPCPPATPNTTLAPFLKTPLGVITTWLCNPVITSTDASHTATLITPDELASGEPPSPSTFEADGAKADLKALMSCANLRRDAKNNKVFLAQ